MNPLNLSDERNWKSDSSHENGNYINACIECGKDFMGHKRRIQCYACTIEAQNKWEAMTPEEQQAHTEKVEKEVREYYANRKYDIPA